MAPSAMGDWSGNQLIDLDASRSSRLLCDVQVEAQDRIIAGLRAMWADLLAEPVPAHLLHLIREFRAAEASCDDR